MSHNDDETPEVKETPQRTARLKKQLGTDKKEKSLPILLMESDLYDWNPGARMTLMVIALGQRTNPNARVPEDSPYTAEDYIGWCDRAEYGIARRVGKSESQISRDVQRFKKDGVIEIRTWKDSNHAKHNMYKINEAVVREHQRPSQKRDGERPPRFGKKASTRGRFSSENQPLKAQAAVAMASMGAVPVMDDEDEL